MEWEPEALQELEKVPSHVRIMAKMAIEMSLGKKGNTIVTLEDIKKMITRKGVKVVEGTHH